MTTENTSSPTALRRIVDLYRKRWTIEEYFKALKSGCSLEKRQVESYGALCKHMGAYSDRLEHPFRADVSSHSEGI